MGEPIVQELKQVLVDGVESEYTQKINQIILKVQSFYTKANSVLQTTNQNAIMNNSIISQAAATQINETIFSKAKELYALRTQSQINQELLKINELIQNGYILLTSIGEILRGDKIEYSIFYEDDLGGGRYQLREARINSVEEFARRLNLTTDISGNLTLGIRTGSVLVNNNNKMEWDTNRLKYTQDSSYMAELSEFYSIVREYQTDIIGYNEVDTKKIKKARALLDRTKAKYHNKGRGVEFAAALYNQFFNGEKIDKEWEELYSEVLKDFNAFYTQGDFWLDGHQIQAKMNNATQELSTILNGLNKLVSILSEGQILPQKVGVEIDAGTAGITEQVYSFSSKTIDKLLDMFKV